jgi:cytochrome c-type biogenesis protein CcmH
MSPFCPGRLIADCPSPRAAELREQIRERIAAGESADAIRSELYEKYGDYVRAAPAAQGFGLLVWVVPFVAVLAGAGVVVYWLRWRGTPAAPVSESGPVLDAESRARLEAKMEAELREM